MGRLLIALVGLLVLAFSPPLNAQHPGTLIDSSPMANAPSGMQAWRNRYVSTSDKGRVEEMTGVVVAPSVPLSRMGRPVLA
jgi:hypothetical protein